MVRKSGEADSLQLLSSVDLGSTGVTAQVWDRLCEIARVIGSGEASTRNISDNIGLSRRSTCNYLNIGVQFKMFRRQLRQNKSALWSLDHTGISALAQASPSRLVDQFAELTKQQRHWVDCIDYRKHGLSWRQWQWMARMIAFLKVPKSISREKLCRELNYNRPGTHRILKKAKSPKGKCRFIKSRRIPGEPNLLWVDWKRIKSAAGNQSAPEGPRVTETTLDDWRAFPVTMRGGDDEAAWRATGIPTLHQWRCVRVLINSLRTAPRRRGIAAWATELGWSEPKVEKYLRLARNEKLVLTERKYDTIPGEGQLEIRVNLPKFEQLFAVKPKAATNGQAKARSNGAVKKAVAPKPTKKPRGGGPKEIYGHLKGWLREVLPKEPNTQPFELRKRYIKEFPGSPCPKANPFRAMRSMILKEQAQITAK